MLCFWGGLIARFVDLVDVVVVGLGCCSFCVWVWGLVCCLWFSCLDLIVGCGAGMPVVWLHLRLCWVAACVLWFAWVVASIVCWFCCLD